MKTGNPRTAGFLSVVALFAIGFALFRIFVPPSRPASSSLVPQDSSPVQTNDHRSDKPFVYGDPFWHPKVASLITSNDPREHSEVDLANQPPPRFPLSLVPGLAPWESQNPGESTPPAETTKPDQQSPKETLKAELTLKAILRVSEPVAFISINGNPTEAYKVGDEVLPSVRVKSIDDRSVRLVREGKTVVLTVGDKAQL